MGSNHQNFLHLENEAPRYFRIDDLPIDVICYIFVIACNDTTRGVGSDGCRVPRLIMTVSRFWRSIAVNEPRLWANIRITAVDGDMEGKLQAFSENLARSKALPLHLTVSSDFRSTSELRRRIKEIATPHLHRCCSLGVTLYNSDLPNEWIPVTQEFQSLKDVRLDLMSWSQQTVDLGLPECLRSLQIHAEGCSASALRFNSEVEHLSLAVNTEDAAAGLQHNAKRLKILEYTLTDPTNEAGSSPYPYSLPQLEVLMLSELTGFPCKVAPQLKHLQCISSISLYRGPFLLEGSAVPPEITSILSRLITLEIEEINQPERFGEDCLIYCNVLEHLSIPILHETSIGILEYLLPSGSHPQGSTSVTFNVDRHPPSSLHSNHHGPTIMPTSHCPNLKTVFLSISPRLTFRARARISRCIIKLLDARPNLLKVNFSTCSEIDTPLASDFFDADSNPRSVPIVTQDLLRAFPTKVTAGRRQSLAVFQPFARKCPRL
ncbi:uncharacterized protein EI90DRAFT_3114605 [Cantharellus anzutake]|uniref:uncharacterized protein n=1 Tax=Cantharellus anzutake TaxID=1750568 RepID=UPI00190527CC|nr:uncharacterized protein EI90DRAFT_3114605 [Cantharellus anzutake]KAF8343963.1 hypothetical protein EI90DRAFT_3114605 [Cantharellus anzutake]